MVPGHELQQGAEFGLQVSPPQPTSVGHPTVQSRAVGQLQVFPFFVGSPPATPLSSSSVRRRTVSLLSVSFFTLLFTVFSF